MRTDRPEAGRHRLGMAGGRHCVLIPAVAAALTEHRRSWFAKPGRPARHTFAAVQRRLRIPARWLPATAN